MSDESKKEAVGMSGRDYAELSGRVRGILEEGQRGGRVADSGLAKAYWRVGDALQKAGVSGRDRYGESVIEKLSVDLEINPQTIRRAMLFRRVYERKILYLKVQNLTWSHFRLLIDLKEEAARRYYEDVCLREGWSGNRLRVAMAGREYERVVKKEKGAQELKRPTGVGYVFGATVIRVVDGDTLVVDLDCGFDVRMKHRIRLAGLDTPEAETKKGQKATEFVRRQLGKARGVVIKTEKADNHGRYVGHVFYSCEEMDLGKIYEQGRYLNGELLSRRMAERM